MKKGTKENTLRRILVIILALSVLYSLAVFLYNNDVYKNVYKAVYPKLYPKRYKRKKLRAEAMARVMKIYRSDEMKAYKNRVFPTKRTDLL